MPAITTRNCRTTCFSKPFAFFLTASARQNTAMPRLKVNKVFCALGSNKFPCMKLKGISERIAQMKRRRKYFPAFFVCAYPSASSRQNSGKAIRPIMSLQMILAIPWKEKIFAAWSSTIAIQAITFRSNAVRILYFWGTGFRLLIFFSFFSWICHWVYIQIWSICDGETFAFGVVFRRLAYLVCCSLFSTKSTIYKCNYYQVEGSTTCASLFTSILRRKYHGRKCIRY